MIDYAGGRILMLTTLLSITDGSASVLGIDVATKDKEVRKKIGVALQDTGLDNLLTGRELFFTTCRLWGYSKKDSDCLLYTSPSPRDRQKSRMPSSA